MWNNILKFLGLAKEEPTAMEKVTQFIATNATGMIIGACVAVLVIALAYGIRKKAYKKVIEGVKKLGSSMRDRMILAAAKVKRRDKVVIQIQEEA